MDAVVHFEMPYDDAKRVARFYESAFGWNMAATGAEMGHYVVATTTPNDDASGRPKSPGAINGGFFARKPDWPGQYPSVVVAVDDVHAAMERVTRSGGKVLGEPMEIPGVGRYVSFNDSEGNRVGMLQPLPRK
jgi:predicted enzyme related to lactoylglutathione lyase